MTTLEIVLSIVVYILFAIVSYKPFKRISNNDWSDSPRAQCIFAPLVWTVLIILAIIVGFTYLTHHSSKEKI